jgi:hypothetical protein
MELIIWFFLAGLSGTIFCTVCRNKRMNMITRTAGSNSEIATMMPMKDTSKIMLLQAAQYCTVLTVVFSIIFSFNKGPIAFLTGLGFLTGIWLRYFMEK